MSAGSVDLGSARGQVLIEFDKALSGISQTQRALNSFGNESVKSANVAGKAMAGFGNVLKSVGSIAGGFVVGQGILKLVDAFTDGAKAGIEFGRQMANVNSIAQLTTPELERLSDQVIRLSSDPRVLAGPAELAAGLYDVQSSGFAGADALTILEKSALAATAGVTTTAVAAKVIAGNLNAFGLAADQAGRVSDVLFQTVNDGVITFEALANNMANTAALAASLGLSIEELGAAYATLTLKNVPAAQAETAIAALMRSALNPTEELTAAVQAHGFASAEALIETEGLAGFLKLLDEAAGGSQEEMVNLLGTTDALTAATILGADGVKDYTKEVKRMKQASQGVGATQRALRKQMESTAFKIDLAKKNFEIAGTVLIGLFAPAIGFVADKLAGFAGGIAIFLHYLDMVTNGHKAWTKSLLELPEPLQRSAKAIGQVVDAIGDIIRAFRAGGLQGAFDEFSRIQGDRLLSGLRTLGEEAWGAFSGAFSALAQDGLDLLVVAVRGLPTLAGGLAEIAGNVWGWVKAQLFGVANPLPPGFTGAPTGADEGIPLGDVIVDGALRLGEGLAGVAGRLRDWVEGVLLGGRASATIPAGAGSRAGFQGGSATFIEPIDLGEVLVDGALDLGANLKDWAGDLWGWFEENIGVERALVAAAVGIPFGPIGIIGALVLGAVLDKWKGNIWGFVKEQLGVGGGSAVSGIPVVGDVGGGNTITLGDVAVDIASWAEGEIANVSHAITGWLNDLEAGEGFNADVATVTLNVLDAIPDFTAADVNDWLQKKLDDIHTVEVELKEWKLILFPPEVETPAGGLDGPVEHELSTLDKINAKLEWIASLDPTPEIQMPTSAQLNDALQIAAKTVKGQATLQDWDLLLDNPDLSRSLTESKVLDWLYDALSAIGRPIATFQSWDLEILNPSDIEWTAGITDNVVAAWIRDFLPDDINVKFWTWDLEILNPSDINWTAGITDNVVALWIRDKLPDDINVPLPDWDLTPGLPNVPSISVDDIVEELTAALPDVTSIPLDAWDLIPDVPFVSLTKEQVVLWILNAITALGELSVTVPFNIIPDVNPFNERSLNPGLIDAARGKGDEAFTVTLSADISDVESAFDDAVNIGNDWGNNEYAAEFFVNYPDVRDGFAAVVDMGEIWEASDYTGTFGADIDGVRNASMSANAIGLAWDQKVFTASFAIDTSGLDQAKQAALEAAQFISDVMPHSPAKEGPLRRPISFQYIADSLTKAMATLGPTAHAGLSALARQFGSSPNSALTARLAAMPARASGSGGGGGNTYIINALRSEELVRILEDSGRGADAHEWIVEGGRTRW